MATNGTDLFYLARKYSLAKAAESDAKVERISIEDEIVALTRFAKVSGSETFSASCRAGSAKLILKQPLPSIVLEDEIPRVRKGLTRGQFGRVFNTKHSVVAKELKVLEESDRTLWLLVKSATTTKPGKIGVELKSLEVL